MAMDLFIITTSSVPVREVLLANEGLIAAIAVCVGPAVVLAILGLLMRGVSRRPIVFIGALMMPIVLTFAIGQLVAARIPGPSTSSAALAVHDGQFVDREKLFGPGIPREFISDAKNGLPGILDEAEVAEVGMTMSGETVLIAQFPSETETQRAAGAYHRGFDLTSQSGDEETGWRATRMQGDHIEMFRTGRQLFVWSGLTREAAAARRAASDLVTHFPALIPALRPALFPALQPLADFFEPVWTKLIGILLLVSVYVMTFFKGVGWCSSVKPVPGALIVPERDLVPRLMSINDLDVPFSITTGDSQSELIADWRYACAQWVDIARAHGMKKTFRIRLSLDESSRTVRATDYHAEYDWSAGRGSASIQWKAAMGIVFFQKEQQTVFGLQFDGQGRLTLVTSYTYRFDFNEMKTPIIAAVTAAGWTWRPTAWQGPSWLRWLTE